MEKSYSLKCVDAYEKAQNFLAELNEAISDAPGNERMRDHFKTQIENLCSILNEGFNLDSLYHLPDYKLRMMEPIIIIATMLHMSVGMMYLSKEQMELFQQKLTDFTQPVVNLNIRV